MQTAVCALCGVTLSQSHSVAGWRAFLALRDLHRTIIPTRHPPQSPAAVRMRSAVAQCHGSSARSLAAAPRASKARARRSLRVYAVNHDPENLFKGLPVAEGIIERRMMSKQMQTDKQFAAMVTAAQNDDRKKLLLRRQSRTPPTDHIELVEFFLNTEADDMEVRVRGSELLCELSVAQAACLAGLLRASDPTAAKSRSSSNSGAGRFRASFCTCSLQGAHKHEEPPESPCSCPVMRMFCCTHSLRLRAAGRS